MKAPATLIPVAAFYPPLASWYNGTAGDLMTQEHTNLLLTDIQQCGEKIHGSFQGLGLVGQFNGTVTSAGRVKFTVKLYAGQMSLVFDGYIKVGGDIAGSFAVLDGQGQHTGEAGIWNVAPLAST